MSQQTEAEVDRAIAAFREGEPVLLYDFDDREGETDLVIPAGAATPEMVAQLRNDAGGLLCVALSWDVAEAFDLPFLGEAVDHPATEDHDLAYDSRSSFSLTVNHRDTFTGITDADRSLTITELAAAAANPRGTNFAHEFRSPGHVHLLKAAESLLEERLGQTELGVALAEAADLPPAVVVCEMLDDGNGRALSKDGAREYADRHGLAFVDGAAVVDRLS